MFELQTPPDYFGQILAPIQRQQQLNINQSQANIEQQELAAKLDQIKQAQAAEAQYQQDVGSVISNPSPEGFRNLFLKHPDKTDGLKQAWDQYSDAQKGRDTSAASQVYAALSNGRADLAAQLLHDRKDALSAAGQDDKITDSLIDMVESNDPAKIKQAQGMAGFVLASSAGPDKIGPMLEALSGKGGQYTLQPGDVRYDAEGNVVASSKYLRGPNGELFEQDAAGSPASGATGAAPAAGGFQNAVGKVFSNEGGYNPKDLNGSPTNFGINYKANAPALAKMGITAANFKDLTKEQAAQLYHDNYWVPSGAAALPANMQTPYFDVYIRNPKFAQKALNDSGGDPQKFMQISSAYFQNLAKNSPAAAKYAKAWANRDADNTAIAAGDASQPAANSAPAATGAPAGYHLLVPGKPGNLPSGYEPDPNKPGAIRPIPGGPADKGPDTTDPQMIHDAATQLLLTGQMPALGMGSGGLKQQILAGRSQLMKQLNISAEQLPQFQAQYKADQNAVTKNSELLSNLQSSENALKANAQQVWNTHKQLVADGMITSNPWMTRQQLKYYANFGSPDQQAHVKAYTDAVNAYSVEYSKFMTAANGMGGSAAPSDAARQQAGELNDLGYQATPLLAHLRQGLTEAINKKNGVQEQNNHLQEKLSSYLRPHSAPSAAPAKPAAPSPGTVVRGYRFKGGNPADPNSWVKL